MPERRIDGKDLLAWTATLVAFPFAGFAARAVVGPVDGTWTALLAGAVSGAVIGLRDGSPCDGSAPIPDGSWPRPWPGRRPGDRLRGGRLRRRRGRDGAPGSREWRRGRVAQWRVLRGVVPGSIWWIPASAVAWALGWTVTTAIGVDPDDLWANPGLSGAATLTLLLAGVLWLVGRMRARAGTPS
jgi:hypothetical protein